MPQGWSFKEDRRLMLLARSSKSLEQVAKLTGRSPGSIKKRAVRLGLSFETRLEREIGPGERRSLR